MSSGQSRQTQETQNSGVCSKWNTRCRIHNLKPSYYWSCKISPNGFKYLRKVDIVLWKSQKLSLVYFFCLHMWRHRKWPRSLHMALLTPPMPRNGHLNQKSSSRVELPVVQTQARNHARRVFLAFPSREWLFAGRLPNKSIRERTLIGCVPRTHIHRCTAIECIAAIRMHRFFTIRHILQRHCPSPAL